ncbi:putative ribonuclease H-like domain-containing protein, partial [Tanacetum coccineum]
VTILNTIDHLGKFDGKANEGFFVGYSLNSKAFRVFNSRTRIVEENLHIRFSENTPNVVGSGPDWLFDIDALTRTMNYEPIVAGTQSNDFADPKSSQDDGSKPLSDDGNKVDEDLRKDSECNYQEKEDDVNNTNNVNVASTNEVNVVGAKTSIEFPDDPNMLALEDISIFDFLRDDEDVGAEADMNNLDTTIQVSHIPTIRIHKDHPLNQVIEDLQSATQTRNMSKNLEEHGLQKRGMYCQPPGFEVKTASTPMETQKPLIKDEDGEEVDVHMYRSIIGSLMYLTSSRPDIMFAVCACARYQVNPKVSHLHAMKRIFRVLDLEKTKTTQANEIASLKGGSRSLKRKIGQNENVVEEVVDAAQVSTATTTVTITTEEITLAQALKAIKTSKPKVKWIIFQEPGKSTTTTTTISSQQSQDNGNGIMIEEPVKPMKKKDQISFDEEVDLKLQAEFDEEERLAREKAEKEKEANIALIEEWDDIQAKIDADYQLAERLQAQEQEELSIEEKATLFQQLLEKRRKHFTAKRVEEKRNKPPTKAQQKKIMCTYLKNMEGYKLTDLKLKDFDSIQEMFDRAFKRVNTFEDFRTELVEGKEKRAGAELVQESTKKQKVKDDKETAKIKKLMEIIPDEEEVAIDAIPLVVKSPSIVDWKIHKKGRKAIIK